MPRNSGVPSREILEAALQGLESQRDKLDAQISQVRSLLGNRGPGRPPVSVKRTGSSGESGERHSAAKRPKRVLSPEARKRIAAAQKKRWAAFRKNQG